MTKDEFLARCANAYEVGLCSEVRLRLMFDWLDALMRLEGGQLSYLVPFLEAENSRTGSFVHTLANDADGYALIQFASILRHPCQRCATDPDAWWTRPAFCEHRKVNQ